MQINILDFQRDLTAKAKSTIIAGMEWMDILQELNLQVLQSKDKYDPTKSRPQTFVDRVATNKIRDLIRHSRAKKRDYSMVVSLDALLEDGFDKIYEPYA